jgi:hypothetical protein
MKSVIPESARHSDSTLVNDVLTTTIPTLRLLGTAVLLFACAITAQAADLTGKWAGSSHTIVEYCSAPPPASDGRAEIEITQTGNTFSGTFLWEFANSNLCIETTVMTTFTVNLTGTVAGETFTAAVSYDDEEEGLQQVGTMTGSVTGDVMTLTWIDPTEPGEDGYPRANILVTAQLTRIPPPVPPSSAITSLWPPNSKFVDIGLTLGSADSATFVVYSDEPAGRTPDATGMLFLRAEREGTGNGRVYLIAVTSADTSGNVTHTCLTAVVPKSQSASDIASVNAEAAAALTQCPSAPAGYFVIR